MRYTRAVRWSAWFLLGCVALGACDKPRKRPSDDDSDEPRHASSTSVETSAKRSGAPRVEDALVSYSSREPSVSIHVAFNAAGAVRCMSVDPALLTAKKGELVAWLVEAGFDVSVSDKRWTIRGKPTKVVEGCDEKPEKLGSFTLLAGAVTEAREPGSRNSATPPDAAELEAVRGVKQLDPSSYQLAPKTVEYARQQIKERAPTSLRVRPGGPRIPPIAPDGLPFALGLRSNDTLKSINGKSVADPQGGLDAYMALRTGAPPMTLELEREGETITLRYFWD